MVGLLITLLRGQMERAAAWRPSETWQRRFVLAWALSVVAVAGLSLSPQTPGPQPFPHADKVFHFVAYAWLGGLAGLARPWTRPAVLGVLSMVALGALMEWGQASVPGRDASALDQLANTAGALMGGWLACVVAARCGARLGARGESDS